ncbi:hypothetical protein CAPTEDRAFT_91279 [Capitella teleta]|uniref:Regucalcin n=1 Tax=Capitella teleta TaxID=283909 RepID=R7UC07_CAPTE|nr:hypothetical protein CAPTEDRAFT_91279 [Capitella teleta]|eukprot:ELU03646.1 hypothetical protein CAPTEDRAFT_91279 [Capitella teleta]
MSVSVLLPNVCSTIGEGPHWDEASQCLYFVDIYAKTVLCWDSKTDKVSKHELGESSVGFIIPRQNGGAVVGVGRKICFLDWLTGKVELIHEVEKDGIGNRFNDGKCDPSGRLWAGTMGFEHSSGVPQLKMGKLFSLEEDLKLKTKLDEIDISNGLAWSADHKTMYYIDSIPRKVFAFDFDLESGAISNRRTCVDFGNITDSDLGIPDGMCIDTEEKLWVACFNGSKVVRFDPITGAQMRVIEFPATKITSCCFGGANFDELFVTSCKYGVSEEEFMKEQPMAGSVFRVIGLGVKGLPAVKFSG